MEQEGKKSRDGMEKERTLGKGGGGRRASGRGKRARDDLPP